MNALLCGQFDAGELALWQRELARACPDVAWFDLDAARRAPQAIDVAVVANPAPGSLQGFPNLKLIQSLWAGVDRLLADATLPADVPIARMVDPAMSRAMAETALWAVLSLHRGFFGYAQQQAQGVWRQLPQRRADEVPVLVLGHGEMGRAAARAMAALGYPVTAWRRAEGAAHDGAVRVVGGAEALWAQVGAAEIVVNLLPLTAATRGLLDRRFLLAMPRGAAIVNLARGAHVVDDDLLVALDGGHVAHAVLDVFHAEPLAPEHPFWRHPRITVLPHAAALTDARSAAGEVAIRLATLRMGRGPEAAVERLRGY